jgi:hypothetical protein
VKVYIQLHIALSKHSNEYFAHHTIPKHVDWGSKRKIENMPPSNYEEILSVKGVGPPTARTGH